MKKKDKIEYSPRHNPIFFYILANFIEIFDHLTEAVKFFLCRGGICSVTCIQLTCIRLVCVDVNVYACVNVHGISP